MKLIIGQKSKGNRPFIMRTNLIYGPPKSGKSSFVATMPNTYFIATEATLDDIEGIETKLDEAGNPVPVETWPEFEAYVKWLCKNKNNYKHVCLDTVKNAWFLCRTHFLSEKGLENENDGKYGYGKGADIVHMRFMGVMNKLVNCKKFGVTFINHEIIKTFTPKNQDPFDKIYQDLPEKQKTFINSLCDNIFRIDTAKVSDDKGGVKAITVFRARATAVYEAGSRLKTMPETIEADYNKICKLYEKKGK